MNPLQLIGQVATELLRGEVNWADTSEGGSARFLLDQLTGPQVAEIVRTIHNDGMLHPHVEVKVPRSLVSGFDLPDSLLTDETAAHWRNTECFKKAIILANTADDLNDTLNDVTKIGAIQLKTAHPVWVEIASRDLPITDEHKKYFRQALKGLQDARECSLEQFSNYVLMVRSHMDDQGMPLINALGWALPALRLPRDSFYFEVISQPGQALQWKKLFAQAFSKRAPLLLKQTNTGQSIESEQLRSAFEHVREEVTATAYDAVELFIKSNPGWTESSSDLSLFEWERDGISAIFSGLRSKKQDLSSETIQFYEDEQPDALTEEDKRYLESLRKRRTKEPTEEDKDFYERHRTELEKNLRAKWDKFVFGQPIECEDFLVGLLQVVERLFEHAAYPTGKKSLLIKTQHEKTKSKWLQLNADVGQYFCTRYKGIDALTGPNITWETHWLFKYDELLASAKTKDKYKKNTSEAKSSMQIKFYVELNCEDTGTSEKTQLIWKYQPGTIGLELYDDLKRLQKNPFCWSSVSRESVSKKGKLQDISLNDIGTLMAVFGQDRGSLVSTYDKSSDLSKNFLAHLEAAHKEGRLNLSAVEEIKDAWNKFCNCYQAALQEFTGARGLASDQLLQQSEAYRHLIQTLLEKAPRDRNRIDLLQPLLRLGNVRVDGNKPAAIITPWHPLRLAALVIKTRQVTALLDQILTTPSINFGDPHLFFGDLKSELAHPYYPEVSVGYLKTQPLLLSLSDTVNDFSLMEPPVSHAAEQTTNENPTDAASKVLAITERYLELMPHERANLAIALYNCDSMGLPQATVNALTSLHDDNDEVRCQVILRHREKKKLNDLYEKMIESFDADPDNFVPSEVSQDFMARLRIGVMADSAPPPNSKDGKPSDIVFLQDVISRQAKAVWLPSFLSGRTADTLRHVPPRWSRRRPAARDELKSTAYLTCPSQPDFGWVYLDAVHYIVEGNRSAGAYSLPARQISFQDESISAVFEEVHRLGEWVVNYDDLLERRQLTNHGVKVIRYQQNRTNQRSLVISSSSPLNLLLVLVKRRLQTLNLGLAHNEITALAERFIDEANALSGDIVLRAAKRGKFASELMGVVLSKALLRSEIGVDEAMGWFFLDDYASWLGQKEQQIADILAICPKVISGQRILKMMVSEAKYIDAASVAGAKQISQKQLRETVVRIMNALFEVPSRLDRDLWLSRIGDLLIDGVEFPLGTPGSIEQWVEDIRSGTIPIDLSGYSHVFISGPSDTSIESERISISKVERCYQEVFSREQVRELVLAYHAGKPLVSIREQLGDDSPWEISTPLMPSTAVELPVLVVTSTPVSTKESDGIEDVPETKSTSIEPDLNLLSQPPSIEWAGEKLSKWITQSARSTSMESVDEKWLDDIEFRLKEALIRYGFQSKTLGKRLTPNACVIRFKGSDRLRVEDIEQKRSQLLTTHALNIISVVAQPGEIVVSVARPQRQSVSLQSIWATRKLNRHPSGINLSFTIGIREIDGGLLYLNLSNNFEDLQQHAPHTLIAGATGSGKSVLLQTLILDICATNSKDLVHIYLIDPKMGVDYQLMEELPHLKEGIISEQSRAIDILNYLVEEMDSRYLRFKDKKVSNLLDYNQRVLPSDRIPALLLIHDEFAEWMLTEDYKSAVSVSVQRLGIKARAAGIHLIFAAQRPDVTVLPIQLRDNLGNRLILKVESVGTSEISLGIKGAERLLGKGHLAARLTGEPDIIYAQVPFLSSQELEAVVEAIK
jgi:S-DNA-T family DNA segregation ATPase FtsK/SpoIIIE